MNLSSLITMAQYITNSPQREHCPHCAVCNRRAEFIEVGYDVRTRSVHRYVRCHSEVDKQTLRMETVEDMSDHAMARWLVEPAFVQAKVALAAQHDANLFTTSPAAEEYAGVQPSRRKIIM